jgi:hypothetical protein
MFQTIKYFFLIAVPFLLNLRHSIALNKNDFDLKFVPVLRNLLFIQPELIWADRNVSQISVLKMASRQNLYLNLMGSLTAKNHQEMRKIVILTSLSNFEVATNCIKTQYPEYCLIFILESKLKDDFFRTLKNFKIPSVFYLIDANFEVNLIYTFRDQETISETRYTFIY